MIRLRTFFLVILLIGSCRPGGRSQSEVKNQENYDEREFTKDLLLGNKMATGIVNRYKSIVANYLAGNTQNANGSISSIPRNFGRLTQLHEQWLTDFHKVLAEGTPNWASVNSRDSYLSAYNKAKQTLGKAPDRTQLRLREDRFKYDIDLLDSVLRQIEIEAKNCLGIYFNDKVVAFEAKLKFNTENHPVSAMKNALQTTWDEIAAYRRHIASIRYLLHSQSNKRDLLVKQVEAYWASAFKSALNSANIADADQLIAEIDRSFYGEKIFAQIESEIASFSSEFDSYLGILNAPNYAKRSYYVAMARLEDLTSQIGREPINDSMRTQILASLADKKQKIASRSSRLSEALATPSLFKKERLRVISLVLQRQRKKLTAECVALAENYIKTESLNDDPIVLEKIFIDFRNQCYR